tara:strand:- start:229 stop:1182 length:954 start_codon:yes stop_codon:yes gene_type:complete
MNIIKQLFTTAFLLATMIVFSQDFDELSRKQTDSLINNLCLNLQNTYFDSLKANELSKVLNQKLKKEEFYNIKTDSLTKKLTSILRQSTKDIHFYVGRNIKTQNSDTIKEFPKVNFNGGFIEIKILRNNIGYIKWDRCIANDEAFKKIKSALIFLEGCDYLIFDISNNPGGDGRSSGFINQHLYRDSTYQNLLLKRCVEEKEWYQSEVAYNYSDGPKLYDIPVYIITSKNTGSAAEYFAFIAQEMKRATILGETTAGAGNPVTMVSFGDFFAYIPICEIKTYEGKSIEAKGVMPDVNLISKDWINETVEYIIKNNKK